MAKKRAGDQLRITDPETGDEMTYRVPAEIADEVEEYVKCLRAANKAREKKNAAEDACIMAMKEHKIPRVKIDEGGKWLVLEDVPKLKTEKIKEQSDAA